MLLNGEKNFTLWSKGVLFVNCPEGDYSLLLKANSCGFPRTVWLLRNLAHNTMELRVQRIIMKIGKFRMKIRT